MPADDRRHLAGGDGDHRLVHQRDASRGLVECDQGLTNSDPGQDHEIRIGETSTDLRRLFVRRLCDCRLAFRETPRGGGHEQIAGLDALLVL